MKLGNKAKYSYAFSPNGDGTNDIFYIRGSKKGIKEVLKFKNFDRWGELIFKRNRFQLDNNELL